MAFLRCGESRGRGGDDCRPGGWAGARVVRRRSRHPRRGNKKAGASAPRGREMDRGAQSEKRHLCARKTRKYCHKRTPRVRGVDKKAPYKVIFKNISRCYEV